MTKQKQKQKQNSQSGKVIGDICATLMIKSFYFIIDFFKALCSTIKILYQARQNPKQIKTVNKQFSINKDVTRKMYIDLQKENNQIFDKKKLEEELKIIKNDKIFLKEMCLTNKKDRPNIAPSFLNLYDRFLRKDEIKLNDMGHRIFEIECLIKKMNNAKNNGDDIY